jgi:hypothetical protein
MCFQGGFGDFSFFYSNGLEALIAVYWLQFVARQSFKLQLLQTENYEGQETAVMVVFYLQEKRPPLQEGTPNWLRGQLLDTHLVTRPKSKTIWGKIFSPNKFVHSSPQLSNNKRSSVPGASSLLPSKPA